MISTVSSVEVPIRAAVRDQRYVLKALDRVVISTGRFWIPNSHNYPCARRHAQAFESRKQDDDTYCTVPTSFPTAPKFVGISSNFHQLPADDYVIAVMPV